MPTGREIEGREKSLFVRPDQFLLHPSHQPKAEIADYVEDKGIIVPRRFASLDEARDSGKPFIVRSEHPQEYAGASGLLASVKITPELIEIAKDNITQGFGSSHDIVVAKAYDTNQKEFENGITKASLEDKRIQDYCGLLGLDPNEFRRDISYSYWEAISGYNRFIIADSAIPGRHHLLTRSKYDDSGEENFFYNLQTIENGEVVINSDLPLPVALKECTNNTITFYETVRRSEKFNPNHCPIVEFQTTEDGTNYFLQYHRTRDFQQSTFRLDREPREEEVEAIFVRGATSPGGAVVQTSLWYPEYTLFEEEASFDWHSQRVFSEIMSRKRTANLDVDPEGFDRVARRLAEGHTSRSALFNPQLSVVLNTDIIPEDQKKQVLGKVREGEYATVPIHVVSDGRKAFVSVAA